MVKLDVSLLRYMTKDDFRVLVGFEMGMRNHELVPRSLVYSISGVHNGSISKILVNLTQNKLLSYERGKRYDGYRLTYRGYDFLALNVLRNRAIIGSIANQIGVGKESDVYIASNDEGQQYAVKFHRLGRTCFKKVSEKRDYQKKNQNHKNASWIYLSRLSALREYAFMKSLYERQILPIPKPIDCNRHCIVMELINGSILNHFHHEDFKSNENVEKLYKNLMQLIMTLANDFGVVHGDFNEFNILIKLDGSFEPVLIDFPQMISINHELAQKYFERDVNCVVNFFSKRFNYESDMIPVFESIEVQNTTNELQEIVGFMEDENKYLENLQKFSDSKLKTTNETDSQFCQKNEILMKFLNSLPEAETSLMYDEIQNSEFLNDNIDKNIEKKFSDLNLETERVLNSNLNEPIDQNQSDNESNDKESVQSYAYSTTSTFTPQQIKDKLLKERNKQELRKRMKVNPKKIKGNANLLRRQKRNDQKLANEDLKSYTNDSFW